MHELDLSLEYTLLGVPLCEYEEYRFKEFHVHNGCHVFFTTPTSRPFSDAPPADSPILPLS